ncbi:MAG: hypothetical protein HY690_17345 [Chloroflexi bacterium]|nr:hypothetical protein [Chloroflexota bacterium]
MYDPLLQTLMLQKLARWRRLTLGDLLSMLAPEQCLRFRPQVLQDLESAHLIAVQVVGDEAVLTITEAGERWLESALNEVRGNHE